MQLSEVGDQLKEAVGQVIDSGNYILGPQVETFERAIASYCGAAHAIGVSSGTDALLASLMALGVGPGDLVITTPYSFFASAGVIARLGARPVFVDIRADTYLMDAGKLQDFLASAANGVERVKAIIPVHLFGQCAPMNEILELAESHGIPVIEDAAQAIGAKYPAAGAGRSAGSIGLTGCLSFFPSKNLGGLGDGGMILTNDPRIADLLQRLRNHGARPKYYHALIGGNFRLDAIQAAALAVKLRFLDRWTEQRRSNAGYYDRQLASVDVGLPVAVSGSDCHVYNQYVIRAPERDRLREFLAARGVGTEIYYPLPFHLQECFRGLGYKHGDFPCSEYAAQHSLALPIFPGLSRQAQDYTVQALKDFYAAG